MKKLNLITLGLFISLMATFYSCKKDKDVVIETYSISGTTWIYSDDSDGGKNTFMFTSEELVSFKQDWIDTGVEHTETKEGTYVYNHPSVTITVGGKEYAGTVDGETMTIGGFVYHKQ